MANGFRRSRTTADVSAWIALGEAAVGISVLHRDGDIKFDTVGKPIPGTEVKVTTEGEIISKTPSVFLGYYKMPEETAKAGRMAMLTSRFNTMLSIPMLFCMVAQQNGGF